MQIIRIKDMFNWNKERERKARWKKTRREKGVITWQTNVEIYSYDTIPDIETNLSANFQPNKKVHFDFERWRPSIREERKSDGYVEKKTEVYSEIIYED